MILKKLPFTNFYYKILKPLYNRVAKHSFVQKSFEKVKSKNLFESVPLVVASVLTGVVSVLYERIFELMESFSHDIFKLNNLLIFVSAPVFMLIAWWLVERHQKMASGSGIPQLMAAVEIAETKRNKFVHSLLNLRVLIVKIVSSSFMLLGGGAIGREGPTLQIAGSIFATVHKYIPASWGKISLKNMLITGGASGLAAAFNTPLGGIVYVVEELTKSHIGKYRTAVFGAVIIAGMTAQLFLGPYLFLGFPKINAIPFLGILWVVLFAFIAGYLGALFTKILLFVDRFRRQITGRNKKFLYVLIVSLLFATLIYHTGQLSMGTGKELMNGILFTKKDIPLFAFPARIIGSILSFCVGGAGGIFATSLASGASLGNLLVQLCGLGFQYKNILVLVCMISFLTGVTRSPFTAAILVLEMTDRHSAIFYFLLASMVANLAAGLVMKHSFYDYGRTAIIKQIEDSFKVTKAKLKA